MEETEVRKVVEQMAAETSKRLEIPSVMEQVFTLPTWGLIERIEIHPAIHMLPNTDAAAPYRMSVRLVDPNGHTVPVNATLIARNVRDLHL